MEILSLLFGGVTGLIGKAINTYSTYKLKKLEMDHEAVMVDKEVDAMIKESQAKIDLTKATVEGKIGIEETQAFKYSLKHDKGFSSEAYKAIDKLLRMKGKIRYITTIVGVFLLSIMIIGDAFRVYMRPTITVFYTLILAYITYDYLHILQIVHNYPNILTSLQKTNLLEQVINAILYITGTCTTWWFADRDFKKTILRSKVSK